MTLDDEHLVLEWLVELVVAVVHGCHGSDARQLQQLASFVISAFSPCL